MEGPSESFSKFKTFLNILFIRRKREGFNDNDFTKVQFEYIQPHLEDLLPLISMEEAQRIKIYFHNAYTFHLNNGLRIANTFPQRSFSPKTLNAQEDVVGQSSRQERLEDDEVEQLAEQERLETQMQTVDDSELSSRQFAPEQSGPLMQSTPLSVPLLPGEPRILNAIQQEEGADQDVFVADILSQLNISPIPILSAPLPSVQSTHMPTPDVELNAISFLRNFENIQSKTRIREQPIAQNTPRRTRKRQNAPLISREAKKMMDKVKFGSIYLFHKTKTDKQIKLSEESFLYFFIIRGKQENIISRSNTIIPEGERGHISLQRVNNLSNILRAHASQSQMSVEQPVQISQINSTRSPLTPQGLLQTSLPFTPLRGDISGFEPRTVLDQATSFPTRSLLRQQPLLPIPERESSIHIPDTPIVEEMYINDLATFSNLPREDPVNDEMMEGQLLHIAYNDPSQNETQQKQVSLNSSVINIQPLIEHEPISPLRTVENQPSIVPGMISGNFEIIEQPQPPVDALTLDQQSLPIDREIETRSGLTATSDVPTPLPGFFQEQPHLTPTLQMQLQQPIAQAATPLVDEQSDNLQFNWFEILRPRGDLVEYPQDVPTSRRIRKRRRRRRDSADRDVRPRRHFDLPAIPRSPSHANINELSVAPEQIPQNQESLSMEDLNPPQQEEVANEIIQDLNNLVNDLAENPLSPPARCSEGSNGISDQITYYPIQIETQLKEYLELIKRAGRKLEYVNWERFDSCLFNENDRFELYTNIFKRIIKDNYVAMDRLYEHGTTRLEAAKGFRFILDLKTMGLIEIESVETRILGIRLITAFNTHKL